MSAADRARGEELRSVPIYGPLDRRVLGMPGPVWTMALWFAASICTLTVAFFFPMSVHANDGGKGFLRIAVLVYAVAVLIALLRMRGTTPRWFLYVQTVVSIVATLWIVQVAVTSTGAVTTAIALIVAAAYMGWWMNRGVAVVLMLAASVGLYLAFASAGRGAELAIPWLVVSMVSWLLLLAFGALVAHMREQMITDPLTGLLNRAGMAALLDARSENSRLSVPRSLVVIDLDGFKDINDHRGHLAGDHTLSEFGAALRRAARPDDVAFRSGGDEFVVILPRTAAAGASAFVTRLRSALDLAWSYGITEWSEGESFDTALARADRLMYQQKARRARPAE